MSDIGSDTGYPGYGPYCDVADVQNALNPQGLDPPPPGSPASLPTEVITDNIDEAQTRVDTYLAQRYSAPFAVGQVPDQVARMTRDIAAYLCTLAAYGGQPVAAGHPALLRYQAAITDLRALASGAATLARPATDNLGNGAVAAAPVATVANPYYGSLFDPCGAGLVVGPGGNQRLPWP